MKRSVSMMMALALFLAGAGQATAGDINIDFGTYSAGTPISSLDGITFTTYGGPGPGGTPVIGIDFPGGLSNSVTGNYPSSQILDFAFSTPVSNVSFFMDNYGDNPGATYSAYGPGMTLLETGSTESSSEGAAFTLSASGITDLQWNNFYGGFGESWEFVIMTFSATTSVPEPSTVTLMGLGVAGVAAFALRRRKLATA
jgi:hypothetical protein